MRRTTRSAWRWALVLAAGLAALACDEGPAPAGDGGPGEEAASAPPATGLPVAEPTGDLDDLAAAGEALYTEKGCLACHTIGGGRLTGPDLAGVTERREFEWFYRMVTSPDSMTRSDPIAQELLNEYMTPMPNLAVQPQEVRALWAYLKHEGAEAEEEDDDDEDQESALPRGGGHHAEVHDMDPRCCGDRLGPHDGRGDGMRGGVAGRHGRLGLGGPGS